jgi:amino acid transporter/nucleotide-binding universal stress UspA family protein
VPGERREAIVAAPAQAEAAHGQEPRTELSRDLTCFDITMIGVGAMIGAGIFVLTGIAAGTAGPALILAFALNGIVTILTAMVYAELGSAIPEAGGGYLWIKEGLPGGSAFLAGWMSWFAHAVAGSLYALGFGAYLEQVLAAFGLSISGLHGPWAQKALAAAVAVLFLYINYRGVSETGMAGNVVTIAKIAILAVFVGSGLLTMWRHPEFLGKFTPFLPNGWTGVLSAMGLTFVAFEGYEIIVQAGEEVRDPRRNLPRAVFWSLAIVIPIYLLVAFTALGAVSPETGEPSWQWLGTYAELGLVQAARQFMPLGTTLLLLGGLLSTMSALNATTFSSTRVSFAMGRDRNLPDLFAHINRRTRTPVVALAASGAIIIAVAVAVPIEHVAAATDIMFLLLFLQVNIAAVTIRKKYGDKLRYGYVIPFFAAVTILGVVTKLLLALALLHYSPLAWSVAALWIAAGWLVWRGYASARERGKRAAPVLATERLRTKKERFRVLVPVDDVATMPGLVHVASQLARIQDGDIVVLHTVAVPRQVPPSAGRPLIQQARATVDHATALAERAGARVSALVRVSHRQPWRAVVDTIVEYRADVVILGWRGRPRSHWHHRGREIDRILTHANCDLIAIQNPPASPAARVLVAVSTSGPAELMLSVARLFAARRGVIELVHVTPKDSPASDAGQKRIKAFEDLAQTANEADTKGPRVSVRVLEAADPVAAIGARVQSGDVLVIGPERGGWLREQLYGSMARRLGARVDVTLTMVHRRSTVVIHNLRSFFEFFRDLEQKVREEEAEAPPPKLPDDATGRPGDAPETATGVPR